MAEQIERAEKKWLKIKITGDPSLTDALTDYLVGVFEAGVEIGVDDPAVTAFIELREDAQILEKIHQYARELAAIFKTEIPQITAEILQDQDWGSSWKVHFKPFAITPGLVIAPTWEQYQASGQEKVIVMDPGMAFGTGHHATTALCVAMIDKALRQCPEKRVLDVGTGTGILAMAAMLFGASSVTAIDNDEEAVSAAIENAAFNGMAATIDVSGKLIDQLTGSFDLVVANIIHDALYAMVEDFARLVKPDGFLILSGILLENQVDSIQGRYREYGFSLVEQQEQGEWAALWLRRMS